MKDIIIAIATKIAEYTVEPFARQFGYVIFYNSNIDKFKTELQKLEAAKNDVEQSVQAARRNGEEIGNYVQNWLTRASQKIAEGNSFSNDRAHMDARFADASITNLWLRYQLSRKATGMVKAISETLAEAAERLELDKISYRAAPSSSILTSRAYVEYVALRSRNLIMEKIKKKLKDDSVYLIGVNGLGGVGESTLVGEIARQAMQDLDHFFDVVILILIDNPPDIKKIQSQIAERLGLKFNEETESGRAWLLYDRIKKVNSILIILDDVREKFDLAEVGIPFGVDHGGCKLLLTSRNSDVLMIDMGAQRVFELDILSEEESWSLFEKIAGDSVKNISFKPTAIKIAKRCTGLPLSIVAVAKMLKGKDSPAWKDALRNLSRFDHRGLHNNVYSVFEWCYNNLESEELKALFVLIGSSTRRNSIRDLLITCWGLGLFKNVNTLTDARNRLHKLLDDLKAFSLLYEEEGDWVSMHDITYEAATSIARGIQPFFSVQSTDELNAWPDEERLKKLHRIYLGWCYIHALPNCLEYPEMVELVLNSRDNYLKVPDHFFTQMRQLKVLDLGGLNCIPSPPPSLRVLKNIRALYLCQCMLEDIAIVGELTSLEILSLHGSEIQELPRQLGQLIHLKLLDLSCCLALRIIPANLISSLTRLEELYLWNCFIPWAVEGGLNQSNNATLGELRHLHMLTILEIFVQDVSTLPRDMFIFEQLERYNIIIGHAWKWKVNLRTSKALQLTLSTPNTQLNHGVNLLINSAEELLLSEVKGVRSVLYELNGEGFQQLKHLHIQNNAELQYIINSTEFRVHPLHAFPELECLLLDNLPNLEKICHGALPTQAFTKLNVVSIRGCHRMQNLFPYSMVENLSQIRKIEISECESVAEIIVQEGEGNNNEIDRIKFLHLRSLSLSGLPKLLNFCSRRLHANDYKDSQSITFFSEKVEFPDLQILRLIAINFMKIWNDTLSAAHYSCTENLTCLIVDKCNMMKALFPSSVAIRLVNLQRLEITRCQMLEQVFSPEDQTNNLPLDINPATPFPDEVIFPNLETFVIVGMDNLKSIWPNKVVPNSFSKLGEVIIKWCKKLFDVFPYYMLDKLQGLKKLLVDTCAEMEVVFDIRGLNTQTGGGESMNLKTLSLNNLPKLKHVWSEDPQQTLRFQELGTVKVVKCKSLKHVFPLSVAQQLLKLEVLVIVDCGVEEIVAKDEVVEAAPRLFFPKLTSLILVSLSELGSVYPGKHTFDCPKLRKLYVFHCSKLEVFNSQINEIGSEDQHHPIPVQKVIASLEKLSLSSSDVRTIWNRQYRDDLINTAKSLTLHCFCDEPVQFPSDFVLRFTKLEKLTASTSSFTEIFSIESPNTGQADTPVMTRLRKLKLRSLPKLECIYKEGSLIKPILQNLETLKVIRCSSLKNIVPSSILFQNLDTLMVAACVGLVNLFTSSTARSLLKLRQMALYDCEMMEEIVDNQEEDDASEIAFMKLKNLELVNLPRLKCFCKGNYGFKFPLLRELLVKECPQMETFSEGVLRTPDLRILYINEERGKWSWQGDLNATIRKVFQQTEEESQKNGDSHQNPNVEGASSSLTSHV